MRFIFRPMISPSSLSAFSASVAGSLNGASRISPVRSQATQDPQQAAPPAAAPGVPGRPVGTVPLPGQILPRGSLLDVSV
jgi:hypothetical protein